MGARVLRKERDTEECLGERKPKGKMKWEPESTTYNHFKSTQSDESDDRVSLKLETAEVTSSLNTRGQNPHRITIMVLALGNHKWH